MVGGQKGHRACKNSVPELLFQVKRRNRGKLADIGSLG